MHLATGLALAPLVAAISPAPQHLFANPPEAQDWPHIPSVHESTVQARRILHLQSIGTMSTVFPATYSHEDDGATILEKRPADVGAAPIGLMEYVAACGPEPYHPTLLGVTVATTMKNAAAGSNVTLSMRYIVPPDAPFPPPDPWAYYPANLPRFALIGRLERLDEETVLKHNISNCFLAHHPEAHIWQPGSDVHDSWWARIKVEEVYFFGGFGDRARIGWLPLDEWAGITQDEIEQYRLVGEEGYERSRAEREALQVQQQALGLEL